MIIPFAVLGGGVYHVDVHVRFLRSLENPTRPAQKGGDPSAA